MAIHERGSIIIKAGVKSQRAKTFYSHEFVQKVVKADPPYKRCSSAQSKRRLQEYRNELVTSRGHGDPLFDDQVIDVLLKYAWKREYVIDVIRYLNQVTDSDGNLFSRNLKVYSDTQSAMERFAERDHPSFRWNVNYQKSLEWLKQQFAGTKLRPLSYNSIDDVRRALPKSNTHSGSYWLMSGKKKKGENLEEAYSTFSQDVKEAKANGTFGYPILLGNRTQASGEFDDDGNETGTCKHKTRVVSMVDLSLIMAELRFSKPFQDRFINKSLYAGGKDENLISRFILDWRAHFPKYMSIDYSSFDQTISSWLIEDAFSVIKSCFVMDYEDSALFDVIVHDFIHKDFIINEGVIHSDKGVPSGSMFTQIIDTLVNILVVNTYFMSIGFPKHEMMAMGDDNIIFCGNDVDLVHLSTYISKNFGLMVKIDDKSNEGSTKSHPKFLSRYWTYAGRWRHPKQLISRLAFPERFRDYSGVTKPEHVLMAFILTYDKGMRELMDVGRFYQDHPIVASEVWAKVDSRYLPGSLANQRDYVGLAAA
jgi:hypothetical protein